MENILPVPSVFLEARFFADDLVEERLHCEGVTEARDGIVIHGFGMRHVRALGWTPDYLTFETGGQVRRHRVGRWAELGHNAVIFPLR